MKTLINGTRYEHIHSFTGSVKMYM